MTDYFYSIRMALLQPNLGEDDIRKLVQDGADLEAKDHHGRTPFMISPHFKILASLGANVNATDRWGKTRLHHLKNVKECLELGVKPQIVDKHGAQAIHYACMRGDLEMVRMLFDAGGVETPRIYYYASHNTNHGHEILEFLLKKYPEGIQGFSPYHIRDPNTLKLLLDHGVDPNQPSDGGIPPIHHAIEREDLEVVRVYADNGAKLDGVLDLMANHLGIFTGYKDEWFMFMRYLVKEYGLKTEYITSVLEPDSPYTTEACVCCKQNQCTHACIPCGHKCMCNECAGRHFINAGKMPVTCPVCRKESKIYRIYVV